MGMVMATSVITLPADLHFITLPMAANKIEKDRQNGKYKTTDNLFQFT
jgi:hypothetical protein